MKRTEIETLKVGDRVQYSTGSKFESGIVDSINPLTFMVGVRVGLKSGKERILPKRLKYLVREAS